LIDLWVTTPEGFWRVPQRAPKCFCQANDRLLEELIRRHGKQSGTDLWYGFSALTPLKLRAFRERQEPQKGPAVRIPSAPATRRVRTAALCFPKRNQQQHSSAVARVEKPTLAGRRDCGFPRARFHTTIWLGSSFDATRQAGRRRLGPLTLLRPHVTSRLGARILPAPGRPRADLLRKSIEARSSYLRFIHMGRLPNKIVLPGAVAWKYSGRGFAFG